MVKVELKYIKVTVKKKKEKKTYCYYYPWRPERGENTPRLPGEPGSPAFNAALIDAHQNRRAPDTGKFSGVVAAYRASKDYGKNADSTKKNWSPWLDRIADYFGDLSIRQFDRPEKIRPVIRRWRSQWEDKPRTADYALQVLSTVLAYAVDPLGKIAGNPCEGIKRLYSGDRSEIIWTDADIAEFKAARTSKGAACSTELADAVDLAAHSGLRLGDLIRLSWSHVKDDTIELPTGKSRHHREAIIPLYDGLRAILARIPKRSTQVLTSARRRPWTQSGLSSAVQRVKAAAKWNNRDLHFHDLRGTAATKFYTAGLPVRVIAEIMAWEEDTVEKIIRRYVGRQAATKALIEQLNRNGAGT